MKPSGIFYQFLVIFYLVGVHSQLSQDIDESRISAKLEIKAQKSTGPIIIDGNLDDDAWRRVSAENNFIQREPNNGEIVSEQTEVKILFDEDFLYFGIRCWDKNADQIVANQMQRDSKLFNNDCVEIYLDTYHDHRTAFYFCTNPLGAQWDGIITAGLPDESQNWDWNGVWDNSCSIDSLGWTAELKIPFKTLRFKESKELIWGLNLSRIIPRKREEAFWSPISREYGWWGKFRVSVFGHLIGLENISQPEKFQVKPFILTGLTRDFEDESEYKKKLDIGLDAKYLLTSNLTLDLSLNTDFAQVEADQEQVNLTRFELFFPEKREFFLERANVFRFGERSLFALMSPTVLFFSRRIGLSEDNELVPLIGGVKLTGRSSSYDIGFLNMLADKTSYINDGDTVSIPRTNFSVLRMQKDLGNNSTLGVIGLNKESLNSNDYNRAFGIDANIFLDENTQASAFIAKSFSQDLKGNDYAFNGDILYLDDFWLAYAAQNSIQENFNSEMGFVPRTGIRRTQFNLGISPRPGILNIRKVTVFNNFNYFANQDNILETRFNLFGIFTVLNDGTNIFVGQASNYERLTEDFEIYEDVIIPQDIYKFNNFWGEYRSDRSKVISGKLGTNIGDFYDGDIFSYSVGLNLKIGSRLTAELEYNRNHVKLPVGKFIATIMSTRLIYTFSPKLFVKTFIQWNSDTNTIIGNFLFNLIHTPGGDLYLVYNEELEKESGKFNTINRSVLLKFTYLFSF